MSASETFLYGPKGALNIPSEVIGKTVKKHLKKFGDKVTLIDPVTNRTFTSAKILKQSIQLADSLRKYGIKKGDVIAIVSENRIEYCLPVFAGLYLGATVNVVNQLYTGREFFETFKVSRPKVIFTSQTALEAIISVRKNLDFMNTIVVFGDTDENGHVGFDHFMDIGTSDVDSFEMESLDPETQGALMMCSSGTSGLPKCCLLTQDNFRVAMIVMGDPDFVALDENTVTLAILPFFHIFGLWIYLHGILFGSQLVIVKAFKPDSFLSIIEKYRVNSLYVVPTVALFLANSPLVHNYDVSAVRTIVSGGASLPEFVHQSLETKFNCQIRQIYGMTELSGCITTTVPGKGKLGSVGVLVPLATGKVCDAATGKSLGPNEYGELCFKGPSCMKCYVGNKKATEDIFDDEGFLHSGDLGFYDHDGHFFVVSRLKELIKCKGFQVAPAELESLLISYKGVKEVAVVGKPDERAGEIPVAFVVKDTSVEISEKELTDFISENVCVQKRLHGGVRFVEALPKNQVGKVVRRELQKFFDQDAQ